MDYKINYLSSLNALAVKTRGKMNADDFIRMAETLLKYPECIPGRNVFFDHTDLEFNGVPEGDLEKIRAFHRANETRIGSGKAAIVVGVRRSGAWNSLWSQGQKLQTANQVRVFEERSDALDWLSEK